MSVIARASRPVLGTRSVQLVMWAVFVLAALCVVAVCWRIGGRLAYSDEREYFELAGALGRGEGYTALGQPTAFRPPSWVVILAPFAALGASPRMLTMISAALLVASGLLAAHLGRLITGSAMGILAGVAVMAYPLDLYSATTLYPQVFATACLLALWVLMDRLARRGVLGIPDALLSGVLCAAVALGAPTLVFTTGLVLAWLLWRHRTYRWRFFLLAGIGFAVPILAWGLRNLVKVGSTVWFSTSGGLNLLLGNSPNTTPTSGVRADISSAVAFADAHHLGEVERSAYYGSLAREWIQNHPLDAARLYVGKVVNYFSAYNAPATGGAGSHSQLVVAWASFLVLIGLVIVRFVLARRGVLPLSRPEMFIAALFVLNAPFMAVFFTRTRFRQPLDALLVVEAAVAVVALLGTRRRGRSVDGSVASGGPVVDSAVPAPDLV